MWMFKKIDSNLLDIRNPKLNFNMGFESDRPEKFIMMFLNLDSDLKIIIQKIKDNSEELQIYENLDLEKNKLNWKILRYNSEYIGPISDLYTNFHGFNYIANKVPLKQSDFRDYSNYESEYLILIRNYLIQFRSLFEIIEAIFLACFEANFNKNGSKKNSLKGNSVILNKIKLIKEFANYSIHYDTGYIKSKSKSKIEELLRELDDGFKFSVLDSDGRIFYELFVTKLLEYQETISLHVARCFESLGIIFYQSTPTLKETKKI